MDPEHDLSKLIYRNISQYRYGEACTILLRLSRIERKTFPASEAFPFTPDLLKKANNSIGFLLSGELPEAMVVAYCVVVRTRSTALLQKICVTEQWQARGVGRLLMAHIMGRLFRDGCRNIQLWVDERREAARRLYNSCGFEEVDCVKDYYGQGRNGFKMALEFEKLSDQHKSNMP